MINPDIPIKLREEDLLDRWEFAEHIARILLNQKNDECIVIGIYGKWGSGKSSLINLVVKNIEQIIQKYFNKYMKKAINKWYETNGFFTLIIPYINMPLEYEKLSFKSILYMDIKYKKNSLINLTKNSLQNISDNQKAPILFRFNPWNISTMDKLISSFFQELSIAIEKEDSSKNAKDLAKRLELYSTFFRPFTYYPDSIISSTSKEVKNILKDASNSIKDEHKQTKLNLEDTKKEIEDHLEGLNRKVIIIIDDIDRLTHTEICQIFQLVKINANFKNVIYILLFDGDIVEKALNEISNDEIFSNIFILI
jgi:predicted KAP-like P-loop ATPase